MGSIVAYTAFVWLLENASVSLVATYAYVTPVVAVALGWAILDETITLPIALGALVVIASVAATPADDRSHRSKTDPLTTQDRQCVERTSAR
jgi:drug/metabolite transporter (DMT)-like permease